ncbi:hypothetical protein H0H81_007607 [Sphagnurus paluster]|uniref:Uncharacterized protein n=1 Tax=Sphagnurus paluster TaxID=117069 RepID=A0A9P7GDX4_9AGAR|nr:hypothetical protein H0H81_007607 [Sphagnurus paluster]
MLTVIQVSPKTTWCASILRKLVRYNSCSSIICKLSLASVHQKAIKDVKDAPAPLSVSNDPPQFKSEQHKHPIYNGRPADRKGPPIAIYHSTFAKLKDNLQRLDKVNDPLERARVDFAAKLCVASSDIYISKNDHINNTFSHLAALLEVELKPKVDTRNNGQRVTEIDALVESNEGKKPAVIVQVVRATLRHKDILGHHYK